MHVSVASLTLSPTFSRYYYKFHRWTPRDSIARPNIGRTIRQPSQFLPPEPLPPDSLALSARPFQGISIDS